MSSPRASVEIKGGLQSQLPTGLPLRGWRHHGGWLCCGLLRSHLAAYLGIEVPWRTRIRIDGVSEYGNLEKTACAWHAHGIFTGCSRDGIGYDLSSGWEQALRSFGCFHPSSVLAKKATSFPTILVIYSRSDPQKEDE